MPRVRPASAASNSATSDQMFSPAGALPLNRLKNQRWARAGTWNDSMSTSMAPWLISHRRGR